MIRHRVRLQDGRGDVLAFGNGSVVSVPSFPLPHVMRELGRRVVD